MKTKLLCCANSRILRGGDYMNCLLYVPGNSSSKRCQLGRRIKHRQYQPGSNSKHQFLLGRRTKRLVNMYRFRQIIVQERVHRQKSKSSIVLQMYRFRLHMHRFRLHMHRFRHHMHRFRLHMHRQVQIIVPVRAHRQKNRRYIHRRRSTAQPPLRTVRPPLRTVPPPLRTVPPPLRTVPPLLPTVPPLLPTVRPVPNIRHKKRNRKSTVPQTIKLNKKNNN